MKFACNSIAVLFAVLTATSCAITVEARAQRLDPNDTGDALTIMRKIQCSTVDNREAIYAWEGKAYARRQGEKDKNVFNVVGMNVRACSAVRDEKRGMGFAMVSREILLYVDKDTGEVIDTWDNPWTGETVRVQHVENDPVNWKSYEIGWDGKPSTWGGDILGSQWNYRSTFPLWYPNPLGSAYQSEIGGTYHATEMFNFFGRTDDLLDASKSEAVVSVGWARLSDWLPWMKMNGREGVFYVHTSGFRLKGWDELSDTMKNYITERAPEYKNAPPQGDDRSNMTSWKHYKQWREDKRNSKEGK